MRYVVTCGVPYRDRHGRVIEIPPEVREQIWLAHRLRNELVDIERDHDAASANVWVAHSDAIAKAQTALAEAEQQLEEATKAARAMRAKNRSVAVDKATADAVAAARKAAAEARKAIKTEKDAIRTDPSRSSVAAAVQEGLHQAKRDRFAAQKNLYALYCTRGVLPRLCRECADREPTVDQETGVCGVCGHQHERRRLYWATYNKVVEQHNTAAKRILALRAQGRPAQFRYHRFDGCGRISVQLQRQHGPGCRCIKCTTREVEAWRVVETEGVGIVVSRRATGKPKRAAVADTRVSTLEEAARILAEAADVPEQAIGFEQPVNSDGEVVWTKPRGGGPRYVVWRPVVHGEHLAGLGSPKNPARTPALIASGECATYRGVFQLRPYMTPEQFAERNRHLPDKKRDLLGEFTMRIGDGQSVTLPVVMSRMIPADAEICEAQLVVRTKGSYLRMWLCITVEVPNNPTPVTEGPTIAVHVGWRKREDGSIRVGTWASDVPITVPDDLAAWPVGRGSVETVMTSDSGRHGEIVLPAAWVDLAGRPPSIQGVRATAFNAVLEKTASWLDQHGPIPPLKGRWREPITGADLRRIRSVDRFAYLVETLLANPPDVIRGLVPTLHEWIGNPGRDAAWHGDRHLASYAKNEADQILGRREHLYRTVAKRLATIAGRILVDDVDVASLRRKPREESTRDDLTLPGSVQEETRARAQLASPGSLREFIKHAATMRGVQVKPVNVTGMGRICPRCGHEAEVGDPRWAASASVPCDGCGTRYDQDVTTARAMLRAPQAATG